MTAATVEPTILTPPSAPVPLDTSTQLNAPAQLEAPAPPTPPPLRPLPPSAPSSAPARAPAHGPARAPVRMRRTGAGGRAVTPAALTNAEIDRGWDRLRFQPTLQPRKTQTERTGTTRPQICPDPVRVVRTVVTAAVEVLAGLRPATQLGRWTTPELYDAIARRAGLARRILGEYGSVRPRVRSVDLQLTRSGAYEACVMVEDGHRLRAAGARVEPRHGRWVLSALEVG